MSTFDFVQYTIYVVHVPGTGNIFNNLNSLLQEAALSILLIHRITLFCSIKYFSISLSPLPHPPKNAIPQTRVKIAKYILLNLCKLVLALTDKIYSI